MSVLNNPRLHVLDHPLVRHKVSILRAKQTDPAKFRGLVGELATIEAYEALRDVALEQVRVETPLEVTSGWHVPAGEVTIVPILRAGLGMVDGVHQLVPSARVGHLGMYRDPATLEPVQYLCKLPEHMERGICLLVDPMLATGGSLVAAIRVLREAGVRDLRCLTLVSCPEGARAVLEADQSAQIYTCALDRELNEHGYILPGLGDAGDRICGTL